MSMARLAAGALALGASAGALAEDPPICTDRPAKANAVCTVPDGRFQIETTLGDWSRTSSAGKETDFWAIGPSLLKLGLTDRSDLQLGFTPYVDVRVKQDGPNPHASGMGDLSVRYKHRLTPGGATVQVAAIPFVKLPTANHSIGNGKVEGGIAVPMSFATGTPLTIVLGPELDLLADGDGHGHHLQIVNVINLSATVAPRLTLAGELWTATNFEPADTVTQVTADTALAYAVSNRLQIDAGANFGLNRDAADIELYAGMSIRF